MNELDRMLYYNGPKYMRNNFDTQKFVHSKYFRIKFQQLFLLHVHNNVQQKKENNIFYLKKVTQKRVRQKLIHLFCLPSHDNDGLVLNSTTQDVG